MRGLDPEMRTKALFDLTETIGSIMFFCGALLYQRVPHSRFWLGFADFVVMGAGYSVKGLPLIRGRRRPTA
ncbi:hypothetical protein ACWELO_30095 [Streptomyces sp. NPDC004596]|uniref:hypothetical protein n=1 Tax=Streptomyces sp. DSM 118148 TaxID=3448667 RepID=UPI00403FE6BA